jgi:hypothetical protein
MKRINLVANVGLVLMVGFLYILSSCSKGNVTPVVSIKFSSAQSSYSESQGTVNIALTLSSKASQDISLAYTWASADTATFLGGDFNFISPTPLVIKAGETTANISIQIIDDTQIDSDDVIKLTLVSATNAVISGTAGEANHAMTITNNDVVSPNRLQIDLTWKTVSSSKTPSDINAINLDLFAQYDVVITGNAITSSGTSNSKSINTTGFETIYINATDPDKVYYIAISYTSGTSKVAMAMALNGWEYSNNQNGANVALDYFLPSEVTSAIFIGPFTKSNTSFPFGRSVQTQILRFRVGDFMGPH